MLCCVVLRCEELVMFGFCSCVCVCVSVCTRCVDGSFHLVHEYVNLAGVVCR